MTAERGTGIVDRRAETGPARAERANPLVDSAEVLDLDGDPPPPTLKSVRWPVKNVRMPSHLLAWLRERAWQDGVTTNALIVRLCEAERDGGLPADVREWLRVQAANCGVPGDPDAALVIVLRHLMDRWPYGARLR